MITVLQYLQSSGLGGPTDHVLDIIKYSDRSKVRFIYADKHHDERTDAEFEALGVHHIFVDDEVKELNQLFDQIPIDIVHGHPGANAKDAAMDVALERSIPCVATIATRGPVHWDYHDKDLVYVVSPCEMQIDHHIHISPERHRFIYYSIDIDRLQCTDKRAAKEHWGLQPDQPVIGWIGRVVAWKGPGLFLDIMRKVQEVRPDVQGIMFGDKDGFEPAKRLRDQLGVNVLMPGGIRRKDLAFGAMDIGCFITWGFFEGFGRVGAEIMGSGTPMVCSLCQTNLELGGTHAIYLIPPNNWTAEGKENWEVAQTHNKMWAWTILALLDNPDQMEDMSKFGKERIDRMFDARKMAAEYNELYREIVC